MRFPAAVLFVVQSFQDTQKGALRHVLEAREALLRAPLLIAILVKSAAQKNGVVVMNFGICAGAVLRSRAVHAVRCLRGLQIDEAEFHAAIAARVPDGAGKFLDQMLLGGADRVVLFAEGGGEARDFGFVLAIKSRVVRRESGGEFL